MKTFHIIVYGCQMNYSDAARIRAVLTNCGWAHVDNKEQADVVILDTCSVRQKSEDKVRGQLKELTGDQKVRLTGCMIQHNLNLKKTRTTKSKKYTMGNFVGDISHNIPYIVGLIPMDTDQSLKAIVREYALGRDDRTDELLYVNHAFDPLFSHMKSSFPNVELFFRIDDVGMLPHIMRQLGYEVDPDIDVINEYNGIIPHSANMLFQENTKTAYVPISTGCSQFCAYCIVPYARGLEKNRPVGEIMKEIQSHLANGVEEIVLLGQIVNKHPDFYEILKQTSAFSQLKRIRYTSPYPTYYSPEILALHESSMNLCPHIHMPMQSGSNKILKKMFRGYTAEEYRQFVDNIRSLQRPISITTDIIVGFCDETEEDFLQTLELTEYSQFDMIYIGIYSPRPGTYAAKKYEDNVPVSVKKERRSRLNALLAELSSRNNSDELGKKREIIVREMTDTTISGYSEHMKNVVVERPIDLPADVQVGQFTTMEVTAVKPFTLYGKLLQE